jgi:hypothetical protein
VEVETGFIISFQFSGNSRKQKMHRMSFFVIFTFGPLTGPQHACAAWTGQVYSGDGITAKEWRDALARILSVG